MMKAPAEPHPFVPMFILPIGTVLFCLLYHTTAVYGSAPALGDNQYGWPCLYGFDQDDVLNEFFWRISHFRPVAVLIDLLIGSVLGAIFGNGIFTLLNRQAGENSGNLRRSAKSADKNLLE